jgi:RHS repeat-associated protein
MRKGSRADQPLRFPGQEAAMTWEGAEDNYNVFRWYSAGWGRYSQADPPALGDQNTYAYVEERPTRSTDPYGLYTVHKTISYAPTSSPSSICGSPFACSKVGVALTCTCSCSSAGYFAKADLYVGGTVYYFNGPFQSIKQKPKDSSVKDAESAIHHEFAWHIDPALDEIDGTIIGLELTPHPNKESCIADCKSVNTQIIARFATSLAITQANENK